MPPMIKNTPTRRGPKRFKPSIKALRDIYRAQRSYGLLVPCAWFKRLRRLGWDSATGIQRFSKEGLRALQEAAESHPTCYFDVTARSAVHAGRVTLRPNDVGFIRELRCAFNLTT